MSGECRVCDGTVVRQVGECRGVHTVAYVHLLHGLGDVRPGNNLIIAFHPRVESGRHARRRAAWFLPCPTLLRTNWHELQRLGPRARTPL